MMTVPEIRERAEQPYVAIRVTLPMSEIGSAAPRFFDDIFTWVSTKGALPAGGAILKHNVIDMERELELEFGVPTIEPVPGDGRVLSGVLPSGRYATILYRGPYGDSGDGLYQANAALIGWGKENGIRWDSEQTPAGERFACRMEVYLTDPATEPDSSKWETEITIKLAD
ncbi:GyrI-like domain-containing protein [Chelativorans sp. AA-79]|uniref:GyrI-like domain-containing protein n=1 Tax=Chelativorans sp. AA-79 TaxID=3028735 RepID=UPI0023F8FEC3|nr:GyrI-like domain-containing protein [Chelativorans sp. AA-79]WEX09406.1 GyrI-like domain-containing protein [Chelativorans sp. AA-79]